MKLLADEGVVALGIELGISQHAANRRSMCMGLSDQCRADWNKMSCLSRSTTDGWPRLSRASRFDLTLGHDSAMRTSRLCGMRERPINSFGLARADQGHPRAALDANNGWIRLLGAQHPVQSLPPTCVPLPPWPPLSASGDSDADTLYETRDRNAPRPAPPPPATCAACGCPAW